MKSEKLLIRIIQRKKEVYYPLFTISISYLVYWIFIFFINLADSQVVLPFLFLSVSILSFTYSIDIYNVKKTKFVIFPVFISISICFVGILRLGFLLLINFYYIIPISIHILVSFLIYFILRKEVKKYYFNKNTRLKNK